SIDVSSNLLLVRFLIDRLKRLSDGEHDILARVEYCKGQLQDILHSWNQHAEEECRVSVNAFYRIHVLMGTIERLMGRLPAECRGYLLLHRCIVLLDEVDLTFEEIAAANVKMNGAINSNLESSLRFAS